MRVSIITPCYNGAEFIEQTINSVCHQTYPNVEHIIIDGGSDDATVSIIEPYRNLPHLNWISEADLGQAHAINKGFELAEGDIIGWLNTDDYYATDAIARVVNYFQQHPDAMMVYADAQAIDQSGRSYGLRANVQPCDFDGLVHTGDFIVQPAAFFRASVLDKVGLLDTSLIYTLDYEFWIRLAKCFPLHYMSGCVAYERLHYKAKTFTGGIERMEEMAAVISAYGGDALPRLFRAEAAAYYSHRGLEHWRHGRWQAGWDDWRQAARVNNSVVRYTLYMVTLLIWGMRALPRLRLVANWLRYQYCVMTGQKQSGKCLPLAEISGC